MPDILTTTIAAAGGSALVAGLVAQVRTHGLRRRWTEIGMGLEERATGLASLAAIPVLFPSELETARATGTQLAVLVMRRFTAHPEELGRNLAAATRAHETGWRLDYDLFGVTITVEDRDEAIRAASRLGRAACGADGATSDLRVGIAMCPTDATDLFDAVDVAMRRMRGFSVLDAVAQQLAIASAPAAAAEPAHAAG
ncbi:MAG: hypothetical protein JWM98_371 [Thermoleophilia bacterium]|nr:hypothetical protein [Thermoleophilia bacterium]